MEIGWVMAEVEMGLAQAMVEVEMGMAQEMMEVEMGMAQAMMVWVMEDLVLHFCCSRARGQWMSSNQSCSIELIPSCRQQYLLYHQN
jgi:hypothetical protein